MSTRVLPFASYFNLQSTRMSDFRGRVPQPLAPITQPGPSQSQDQAATAAASLLPPGQVIRNPSPAPTPRSASRNLFGPVDHEENMKMVQAELSRIAQNDSLRWNFDFHNELPLEGRYHWEATKGTSVPPAYEMPNLTARLTQLPTTTSSAVKKVASTAAKATASPPPPTSTTEEPPSSDNSLQSTLNTVTTATTTVYTTATTHKPQTTVTTTSSGKGSEEEVPEKTTSSQQHRNEISTAEPKNKRQSKITDHMKVRKRPRSDSKAEGGGVSCGMSSSSSEPSSSSEVGSRMTSSPPLIKRAKTS